MHLPVQRSDEGDGDHYVWRDVCDGWILLTADDLHVVLERMPRGASEVRHRHAHTRQLYFVLTGEAVVVLGDETATVRAGNGVAIEPGMAHQVRNQSSADLEFLVVSSSPPGNDREEIDSVSWSTVMKPNGRRRRARI
jgi:mannose-6-phosphate isomerase-like protein (cupin superfamily)